MMQVAQASMMTGGLGTAPRAQVTNSTQVRGAAGGSGKAAAATAGQPPVDAMLEQRARTTEKRSAQRMTGPTATRVQTTQTGIAGARFTQADTAGCGVESLEVPINEGAADEEGRFRLSHVTAITTVTAIPIRGGLVICGIPFGIDGIPAGEEAGRGRGSMATQALLGMAVAGGALRQMMTACTGTETESGMAIMMAIKMAISEGPRRTCGTRATSELMTHTMPIET